MDLLASHEQGGEPGAVRVARANVRGGAMFAEPSAHVHFTLVARLRVLGAGGRGQQSGS